MRCVLVNDEATWNEMFTRLTLSNGFAFDTETTHLDTLLADFQVVGMSFAVDDVTGYYIPLNHQEPEQRVLFDLKTGRVNPKFVQLPQAWVLERIKPLLETKPLYGHNIKFDYQVMHRYGIVLKNIRYDTQAAAHIIDERRSMKLEDLVESCLGYRPMNFGEAVGKKTRKGRKVPSHFELVPLDRATAYAGPDAVNVIRLRNLFRSQFIDPETGFVHPQFKFLLDKEINLIPVMAEMELIGSSLDTGHLVRISNEIVTEATGLREQIKHIIGDPLFNPGSNTQMWELLYKHMKIKFPGKKPKGTSRKGMLDKKAIEKIVTQIRSNEEQLAYGRWPKGQVLDLIKSYQDMTKLEKLEGTYTHTLIDKVSSDGRLHTLFNQFGTKSGRLSSEQPNFQNMPRNMDPNSPTSKYDIRMALRADPGWVYVLVDYAQMEMRICAYESGCQALGDIITGRRRDKFGNIIDIHLYTACAAFHLEYDEAVQILADEKHPRHKEIKEFRQKAKPVNFGIIYGMTEHGLAADLNESVEFARSVIQGYMRAYPGVAAWMGSVKRYLKTQLFTETYHGRRRRTSYMEVHDRKLFGSAYRACLNHIIQGTGADIVKDSMLRINAGLITGGFHGKLAGQVHDEIITLCPEAEAESIARMMLKEMYYVLQGKNHPDIPLPAEAEIKRTWSKQEKALWKLAA